MLGEHRYYVLNDKNEVVQEPDGGRWAEFMGNSDNQRTMWNQISKEVQVMTDFSGVDLDWAAPIPSASAQWCSVRTNFFPTGLSCTAGAPGTMQCQATRPRWTSFVR